MDISERYIHVRDAIVAALREYDATCPPENVHPFKRYPLDVTADNLFTMFGKNSNTNKNEGSRNDQIHTWIVTRRAVPSRQNIEGIHSGEDEARTVVEQWQAVCYKSLIDPANTDDPNAAPTEYDFQLLIDKVCNGFLLSDDIRALKSGLRCFIEDISVDEIDAQYFSEEIKCHYAAITLTFSYSRFVAT
jgi:hypothetical protein